MNKHLATSSIICFEKTHWVRAQTERLAMATGIHKHRKFLLGAHFIVEIICHPFQYLKKKKKKLKILRWLFFLLHKNTASQVKVTYAKTYAYNNCSSIQYNICVFCCDCQIKSEFDMCVFFLTTNIHCTSKKLISH